MIKTSRNNNYRRSKVYTAVRRYIRGSRKKKKFIPGKSRVPYAGRVYDESEILGIVDSALDFWLTAGRVTKELEKRLKDYLKAKSFLLVNSGSSANLLMIASLCSGRSRGRLRPGDEVITPAVTFPTTVAPVLQYGLVPVFVDAKIGTYNIDEDLIDRAVSKKTKVIFIPHTLGNPCDMDKITRLARKYGLIVLEDACDALGSRYKGKMVGTFGAMSSFSFYPAHHMTMGEGGGVAINDAAMSKHAASIRDWGRDCYCQTGMSGSCGKRFSMKMGRLPFGYDHKYIYSEIGYNLKVTEMQSAVGLAQFEKLDKFIQKRKDNFNSYYSGLSDCQERIILPSAVNGADPAWFGFPISCREGLDRLELIKRLESSNIETRLMFGGNITRQPVFKGINYRISGDLDRSDYIMNNTFFIGVYPGLTGEMIDYVITRIRDFIKK